MRSTLVAVMFSGDSLGGMLAAGLGIYMLPQIGWSSMFFVATLPPLLLPAILYWLPESVGFLIRQGHIEKARHLLYRLATDAGIGAHDVLDQRDQGLWWLGRRVVPVRVGGAHPGHLGCLLMVCALGSWLTTLAAGADYSLGASLSFLLALNFGGMAGRYWLAGCVTA